jgi:pyruvate/2-oxoglutarate dehydrogenase complex dihydrolipoamide dehydrogenase (E3) component
LLHRDDAAVGALVRDALERDRVIVACGVSATRAERQREDRVVHYRIAGEHLEHEAVGDAVLVATGRVANVEGLGLDLAGVAFTPRGVRVNDFLRTTNRRIYAIGDVAVPYRFTHAADATARVAVQNALFFGRKRFSQLLIPWCTYTSPEVAHVGLTEDMAERQRLPIETVTVPLDRVDRAVIDEAAFGMLAVHLRNGTDRIVGATLVAEHAGDMIGEMTLAIQNRLGLGAVGTTIHPYPTQSEVFRKVADAWRRQKLTPRAQRILRGFFRLVG